MAEYGEISPAQERLVRPVVAGKPVLDLGAGDGWLARSLVKLGASKVTAVDVKGSGAFSRTDDPRIEVIEASFQQFFQQFPFQRYPVSFLSWPVNRPLPGLIDILTRSETIIFLACNTEGTLCGWPALYEFLQFRRVNHYIQDRRNDLVVYGPELLKPRPMINLERAGADMSRIYSYRNMPEVFADHGEG